MNFLRTAIALLIVATLLAACAHLPSGTRERIDTLPATDVLMLGEQHDAPDHQRIHREIIASLAAQGRLAAVALEMADQGGTTRGLSASASEAEVRSALGWQDEAWPWKAYGPAVMAAVHAGIPVVGANLPRNALRAAMNNPQLDNELPGPALKAQQQSVRLGHCGLLPESQIRPMTRAQVARDISLARTIESLAVKGKTVVLLSGSAHADKDLGVPQHLSKSLQTLSIRLMPQPGPTGAGQAEKFDQIWPTGSVPDRDYCEEFKRGRMQGG